jgi:hypothetical protein
MAQEYFKRLNHSSSQSSKIMTMSFWIKLNEANANQDIFTGTGSSGTFRLRYSGDQNSEPTNGRFQLEQSGTGSRAHTSQVFRDTTQFYHVVYSIDTTQASFGDRIQIYVNGVSQVLDYGSALDQNTNLPFGDQDGTVYIGQNTANNIWLDSHLTDFYYVDGTRYDASYFGKTVNGKWVPKHPDGVLANISLGINGFHLPLNRYDADNDFSTFDKSGASTTVVGSPQWNGETPRGEWSGGSSIATGGGYIGVPASTFDFSGNTWTVECWHKPYGVVSNYQSILSNTASNDLNYSFYANGGTGSTLSPRFYMDGDWTISLEPNAGNVSLRTWTHLAFVLDNGVARLYENGVQTAFQTAASGTGSSSDSTAYIGFNTFNNVNHSAGGLDAYTYGLRVTRGQALYPNGTTFTPGDTSGTTYTTDGTNYSAITGTIDFRQKTDVVTPGSATTGMGFRHYGFNNVEKSKDSVSNTFPSFNSNMTDLDRNAAARRSGGYLYLTQSSTQSDSLSVPSLGIPKTGKWYMEVKWLGSSAYYGEFGIGNIDKGNFYKTGYNNSWMGDDDNNGHAIWYWPWDYGSNQQRQGLWNRYYDGGSAPYVQNDFGTTIDTTKPTFMIAVDRDNGKFYFGYNGTWHVGDPAAGTGGITINNNNDNWVPMATYWNASGYAEMFWNFGQDGTLYNTNSGTLQSDDSGYGQFAYSPPSGYNAICSENWPSNDIVPSEHFKAIAFTGSDTEFSINFGFAPDMVICKRRSDDVRSWWSLRNSIRGGDYEEVPNEDVAERYRPAAGYGGATFTSTGIDLGSGSQTDDNIGGAGGKPYVIYGWKAGGAAVTNTDGSITAQVSVNQTAGFSMVNFTYASGAQTIGHGLGKAPKFIMMRNLSGVNNWDVYHDAVGPNYRMQLNNSSAQQDFTGPWNDTAPTSTVFSTNGWLGSGSNVMAYCFAEIEGFSKFGMYRGTNEEYGPFINCGFRPAFVLVKIINSGSNADNWILFDEARNTYNSNFMNALYPDIPNGENISGDEFDSSNTVYDDIDFYSSGFRLRAGNGRINSNGNQFLYVAFASNPVNTANAR